MNANDDTEASADKLRYQSTDASMDVSLNTSGQREPHWDYVIQSFERMEANELQGRQRKMERLLRDDGASFNIYNSPDTNDKIWGLDLVPAIIPSDQWSTIEAGLLERAELFNMLLQDIYTQRTLIRQQVIPPEALFCHPGFLHACQGIQVAGEHQLIIHSVDMLQQADGQMLVLADQTQIPTGSGYALENRTIMTRVFPSLFRHSHVHRLSTYFQRLRAKLLSLGPHIDNPRIVILTPGTGNNSYFEHAYLANYLGFPLVQSGDLVVRNGFLWMKSLDGLKRVDVIWRRVKDAACDPVELRADSQFGVAGLIEVVRAGNLVIANPLGAGILENPVLYRYLPAISRHFLGREPRLASVSTWWYGDADDRAWIDANFEQLTIRAVSPQPEITAGNVAAMTPEQQQTLRAAMKSRPEYFVAQSIPAPKQMPSLSPTTFGSRAALMRSFACASESSYYLLPGGLTRVSQSDEEPLLSIRDGVQSKDTWVIASDPAPEVESPSATEQITDYADLQLQSLPSRAIENLFWMGRYAERAESALRLIRTLFSQLNSDDPISNTPRLRLLEAVTHLTATRPGFIGNEELIEHPEQELLSIINDGQRSGSIRNTLNCMIHSADASKELLSLDTIRVINDLRDALNALDRAVSYNPDGVPEECLDPIVTALMALSGLTHESVVRGIGWHFMSIGKRIERAVQTLTLIKTLLIPPASVNEQETLLRALLLTLEMLITYRRRFRTVVDIEAGLDLALLDATNPRSIMFQIDQLAEDIKTLPKAEQSTRELMADERCVLKAQTDLKLSRLNELAMVTENGRENLQALAERLDNHLETLSTVLSETYFEHKASYTQLVKGYWAE
ncbi:putative protein [BD1-7 clade bacterium]|uniref:Uncharacterized protein n=1 Tax=BD1-7 clade bacterium TaxID=2029982 RepID=A0A5S9MRP4_9GAMM|nr:putative protein [BD1-7 clade bacterium]